MILLTNGLPATDQGPCVDEISMSKEFKQVFDAGIRITIALLGEPPNYDPDLWECMPGEPMMIDPSKVESTFFFTDPDCVAELWTPYNGLYNFTNMIYNTRKVTAEILQDQMYIIDFVEVFRSAEYNIAYWDKEKWVFSGSPFLDFENTFPYDTAIRPLNGSDFTYGSSTFEDVPICCLCGSKGLISFAPTPSPTEAPSINPTTAEPSKKPTTDQPSKTPSTSKPTPSPTNSPTVTVIHSSIRYI